MLTVVVVPVTVKFPATTNSSFMVTVELELPILIGTLGVDIPIEIPFVVSVVSKSKPLS